MSTDEPHDGQLETEIAALAVSPASAACVWLGQGGYLFKSPRGTTVMVDAYLSDYAAEFWGVTRAIPPVVDPARIKPDVFLVTHWHEDHLDAPTVRHYAQQPDVVFAGPESCVIRARIWGWPAERTVTLERGDRHQFDDVHVTATFARHDEDAALTLDAVGFLLDFGGVRIWNVADSEYDARLRPMRDAGIDVMLVPINGVGGNMNCGPTSSTAQAPPSTRRRTARRLPASGVRRKCGCWSLGRSSSSRLAEQSKQALLVGSRARHAVPTWLVDAPSKPKPS
ncbi:MAG: Zn-dependent hydrolase of the beta-lactamase fold-like protein [Thermomicrobiales bacterium]|nr:Zn-dependent hydrolase of the beta-lactamase fold-like protein [Thermomicrobiales bacterium]